jgi:hypothetical protein
VVGAQPNVEGRRVTNGKKKETEEQQWRDFVVAYARRRRDGIVSRQDLIKEATKTGIDASPTGDYGWSPFAAALQVLKKQGRMRYVERGVYQIGEADK